MKFYISAKGIKRVTISSSAGGAGGGGGGGGDGGGGGGGGFWGKGSPVAAARRVSHRAVVLPAVLVLALLLPFLFVRVALLVLDSATVCSSSLAVDCMAWRLFGGSDTVLREELTRALLEATNNDVESGINKEGGGSNSIPDSFSDLVKDMTSNRQDDDIKSFVFKTKAMMLKMEHLVQTARRRESVYWHIASHGFPKSLHCLSLKLAEEYAVNAMARSRLPPPEFVSRLTDPSFHHVVLLTDNVLAASVVVSSAIKSSVNPEKLVFHIVTDKRTYTPMHAWFAVNSLSSAVIEVKGLHQYDWSHEVNIGIKETLEIHRLIWRRKYESLKAENFEYEEQYEKKLMFLSPSCVSLLNQLRIYIPELFPELNKILFLDDDVVVERDLSSLWDLDLNGKVVGAVVDSSCGHNCCPGRTYKDYFNFTDPLISSILDFDRCGWLYGMNIFDLQAWRKTTITATYHQWLRHNLNSGFVLWEPGALPPALVAFEGHVLEIDPSWHMAGLGYRNPQVDWHTIQAAAVIHFSGPAKPWQEIAAPELRSLWYKHINFSNESVRKCGITG